MNVTRKAAIDPKILAARRLESKLENLRVGEPIPFNLTPRKLKDELLITEAAAMTVASSRASIIRILHQEDPRLLVVVGPCSTHREDEAVDYAKRLKPLRDEFAECMEIVMRVFFEKPRTTVGYEGIATEPNMDGVVNLAKGLRIARRLLLVVNELGLPAATEFIDEIIPQYIGSLVSWSGIGARSVSSGRYRKMGSGLSMPVGVKNNTDGNVQVAVDAIITARYKHTFRGVNDELEPCMIPTKGNPDMHLILRGSETRPNYDAESIRDAENRLRAAGLPIILMVDCSHGNSGKRYQLQEGVFRNVIQQRVQGTRSIIGVEFESNINEGNQPIPKDLADLRYGVSVTDACVSWETTARMIRWAGEKLREAKLRI